MPSVKALVHTNINRARHSLPFLEPATRELIALIAPLLCLNEPAFGVYGHPACSATEYHLLQRYLGGKPLITPERMPDRVYLESLIAIPEPCPASRENCAITLIGIPTAKAPEREIAQKFKTITRIMEEHGMMVTCHMAAELPPLDVYAVMRTGIVLAGKYPVTSPAQNSENSVFIGRLPERITETASITRRSWNPYTAFLDLQIKEQIGAFEYITALEIEGVHPYLLPYLPLIDRHENELDAEKLHKLRRAIHALLYPFAPTRELMQQTGNLWKIRHRPKPLTGMPFNQALRVREYFIPLEENELPLYIWPQPRCTRESEVKLNRKQGLWSLENHELFRHKHAWVVLAWGALAGLISADTRVKGSAEITLLPNAGRRLTEMVKALAEGADLLVPEDHLQGSIEMRAGRFFYSDKPFAALEKGHKFCLELEQEIKRKAFLDDKGLDKIKKFQGEE